MRNRSAFAADPVPDARRMLAYSSVSQLGYNVMGICHWSHQSSDCGLPYPPPWAKEGDYTITLAYNTPKEALVGAGEDHRVVADDAAAAQRRIADVAGRPGPGVAVARADRAGWIDAAPVGRRVAQQQRGPRRGVHRVAVVHFHDLDVEILAERPGRLANQRGQEIDP